MNASTGAADVLGTEPAETTWTEHAGKTRTVKRHQFLDFTVNGQPLRSLASFAAKGSPLDEATRLADDWPEGALEQLDALLGGAGGRFDDQRVPLLVCQVCGGLGCRSLSAEVRMDDAAVEWRGLGWQVNYGPYNAEADAVEPPRAFRFDRTQYESVLRPLRQHFAAMPTTTQAAAPQAPRRRWWNRS